MGRHRMPPEFIQEFPNATAGSGLKDWEMERHMAFQHQLVRVYVDTDATVVERYRCVVDGSETIVGRNPLLFGDMVDVEQGIVVQHIPGAFSADPPGEVRVTRKVGPRPPEELLE